MLSFILRQLTFYFPYSSFKLWCLFSKTCIINHWLPLQPLWFHFPALYPHLLCSTLAPFLFLNTQRTFPLQDLCSWCSLWLEKSSSNFYSCSLTSFRYLLKCQLMREARFSDLTKLVTSLNNPCHHSVYYNPALFFFLVLISTWLIIYLFIFLLSAFPHWDVSSMISRHVSAYGHSCILALGKTWIWEGLNKFCGINDL